MSRTLDYQLMDAAMTGDLAAVEHALLAGADVHAIGDGALQKAAYNGHKEVVALLLKSGADIHVLNDRVLQLAAHNGHKEVVKLLLKSGADITSVHQEGGLSKASITSMLKQHATTAVGGYAAVMMLATESRLKLLRHLHPELKPKQIRDEMAILQVFGLPAAQMAKMWQARHGAATTKQDSAVSP